MNHSRLLPLILFCCFFSGATRVSCAEPAPPAPPARSEVEAALHAAGPAQELAHKLKVVLLADKKDHGANEHDYPLWQERWALLLGGRAASTAAQVNLYGPASADPLAAAGAKNVEVACASGWPADEQFASADVIISFCYLPWTAERKQQLKGFLERGGGLVLIHSATWTKPQADAGVAALVGVGGFTRYRHGVVQLEITAADHPICKGLPRQLSFFDETYWPPTPPLAAERVTTLAVSREKTAASSAETSPQPMFWICRSGRGRVFGCVLGHYTWTFDNPWFRLLMLRGIAWTGAQPVTCLDALALR
jgi:type 1 glutamine amidotransferase